MKPYTINAVDLLNELVKHYTYEELAGYVGKGKETVVRWAKGKSGLSKGDFQILQGIWDKIQEKGVE